MDRNVNTVYWETYIVTHPEFAAKRAHLNATRQAKERFAVLELLGGKCVECNYDANPLALHIDHIKGHGGEDRASFSGPSSYYRYIMQSPVSVLNYQILCANCNVIKRVTNGECRWEYGRRRQ